MSYHVPPKSPGLAAVLSAVWTGLGQIYNGQIGKGVLFMVIQFINALLIAVLIGIITYPLFWIYGMVDAYKTAEMLNRGEGPPRKI
ncbi:hypothetical protein ACERII_14755 [Evansella sp. AB-rgal1]|uniref:hypothetical protein n=1 Tax=Evansella sp. AB-rgal1 TaxID=3242696 RepID=UPI00359E3E30